VLYVALAVFGFGLIYKIFTWFRRTAGIDAAGFGAAKRILAAVRGSFTSIFSRASWRLLTGLLGDVLMQRRLFRQDRLRWLAHFCIFVGFSALFLMDAMAKYTITIAFPGYLPTLNPYLFLRDLFGTMVIVGLVMAIGRRFGRKGQMAPTTPGDVYAIAITAMIILSGVLLEGAKINSYSAYREMVECYAGGGSEARLLALEAYWVMDFAVASPNMQGPFDAAMLAQGKELHRESCGECHARARWGFLGYSAAKAIGPVALAVDRANLRGILLVVHYLSCFLALGLDLNQLPFGFSDAHFQTK
jgi:hypothetical protein